MSEGTPTSESVAVPARVVAVIVTFNRRSLLERCIDALGRQSLPPTHIVVVDNGSDGAGEAVRTRGTIPIQLVLRPDNPGPAGGFADGIASARALGAPDWLWLFNDDAWPEPPALERMVAGARSLQRPGLLGPGYVADGGFRVAGGRWDHGRIHHATHVPAGSPLFLADLVIFNGALLSGAAARSVALPRSEFWMMFEEWDYSLRVAEAGFTNAILPEPLVHHDWGGSAAGRRAYYQTRNHLLMVRARRKPREALAFAGRTARFSLAALLKRPPDLRSVSLRARGLVDGLRGVTGRTV